MTIIRTSAALAAALLAAYAAPAMAQTAPTPSTTPAVRAGAPGPTIKSPTGPGGRNITAFDRNHQSGVGGYYDLEFMQPFSGKGSYFNAHRFILQTSSYMHENLMFNAELEFEYGGILNTMTGDGELKVEQAWADWRLNDALAVRGGVLLVPFGVVNVLHDSDVRETTARPLMASAIVPTTWMEAGVGAHGVLYPTEDLMVNYEAIVTNGLTDQISAADGLKRARPSMKSDNNGNKAVAGRVGVSPWLGLEAGLNGYYGAYDASGTTGLWLGGADLQWTAGPFEVVGEYARVGTGGGTATIGGTATAIPLGMQGYYGEARYRFFPSLLEDTWLGRGGGFERATFTAFARYGGADTDLAAGGSTDKVEYVVGMNYRPIQTFVPKIEYRRISEPLTGKVDDGIFASLAAGF